jgi:hypothetical protein
VILTWGAQIRNCCSSLKYISAPKRWSRSSALQPRPKSGKRGLGAWAMNPWNLLWLAAGGLDGCFCSAGKEFGEFAPFSSSRLGPGSQTPSETRVLQCQNLRTNPRTPSIIFCLLSEVLDLKRGSEVSAGEIDIQPASSCIGCGWFSPNF